MLLTGGEAGQEPHQRTGVAAVDRPVGRAQAAQADAAHANRVDVVLDHLDAERAHRADRRLGVARATEVADRALALGDRAEQHRALRQPFDAGHGDVADERSCRSDLH